MSAALISLRSCLGYVLLVMAITIPRAGMATDCPLSGAAFNLVKLLDSLHQNDDVLSDENRASISSALSAVYVSDDAAVLDPFATPEVSLAFELAHLHAVDVATGVRRTWPQDSHAALGLLTARSQSCVQDPTTQGAERDQATGNVATLGDTGSDNGRAWARFALDEGEEDGTSTANTPGGVSKPALAQLRPRTAGVEDHTSYKDFGRKIGLLLAALTAAFACVWLLYVVLPLAYYWGFTLINRRNSCRISAFVEADLETVDGYITILGRRGCRFVPVNPGAFDRLIGILAELPAQVVVNVGEWTLKSEVRMLSTDRGFKIIFAEHLGVQDQAGILARSLVLPQYIALTSVRDNREDQRFTHNVFDKSEAEPDEEAASIVRDSMYIKPPPGLELADEFGIED